MPLKTVEKRLLAYLSQEAYIFYFQCIYTPEEAYSFVFQCIYSAFKECQSVFKKPKSLLHRVRSRADACNLAPHPKETKEQEEEMQMGQARWLMEAKAVRNAPLPHASHHL
jgi:hypothetical protein